jgi:hypothetical protein
LRQCRQHSRLQQRIDVALRVSPGLRQQGLHRERPKRQTHRAFADPVAKDLCHLETPATHVADETSRPVQAGDDAQHGVARFFRACEDADRKAGLASDGCYELIAGCIGCSIMLMLLNARR